MCPHEICFRRGPSSAVVFLTSAAVSVAKSGSLRFFGSFAHREQQAPNLQDFKGGSAVIFVGSGTVLILVIVLLILLI